jgi:hypothetical protein
VISTEALVWTIPPGVPPGAIEPQLKIQPALRARYVHWERKMKNSSKFAANLAQPFTMRGAAAPLAACALAVLWVAAPMQAQPLGAATPTLSTSPRSQNVIRAPSVRASLPPDRIKIFARPPIPFKPFATVDLRTNQPIDPNSTITIPDGRRVVARQYFDELNQWEAWLNARGYSLRTAQPKVPVKLGEVTLDRAMLQRQMQLSTQPTNLPRIPGFMNLDVRQTPDGTLPTRMPFQGLRQQRAANEGFQTGTTVTGAQPQGQTSTFRNALSALRERIRERETYRQSQTTASGPRTNTLPHSGLYTELQPGTTEPGSQPQSQSGWTMQSRPPITSYSRTGQATGDSLKSEQPQGRTVTPPREIFRQNTESQMEAAGEERKPYFSGQMPHEAKIGGLQQKCDWVGSTKAWDWSSGDKGLFWAGVHGNFSYQGHGCNVSGKSYEDSGGYFAVTTGNDASLSIFGIGRDIFHMDASVSSSQTTNQMREQLLVTVDGQTQIALDRPINSAMSGGVPSFSDYQQVGSGVEYTGSLSINLGPFSIAFSTGVRGSATVQTLFVGTRSSALLNTMPTIKTEAWADAGLSAWVASVDAGVKLIPLEWSMPIWGVTGIGPSCDRLQVYGKAHRESDMTMAAGSIYFTLKISWCLFGCTSEYNFTIYDWPGLHYDSTVFDFDENKDVTFQKYWQ